MFTVFVSIIDLLVFGIALYFVIKSAGIFLYSLERLALTSHTQLYAMSGLIAAVGTSLPELFVGISSSIAGQSDFVLGVVIGSNIVLVSLIIGLSTLIGGSLTVVGDFVGKDVLRILLISITPFALMLDKTLSRLDSFLLLLLFVIYHIFTFHEKRHRFVKKRTSLWQLILQFINRLFHPPLRNLIIWGIIGIIMLLFSSEILVQIATIITHDIHLPTWFVGMVLIGLGTSIPELVLQIEAGKNEETGVVFGNLFGSLVANSTLVLGIAGLISPINLTSIGLIIRSAVIFITSFLLLWLFIKTKYKLQRWEGLVLVSIYILFLLGELGDFVFSQSSVMAIH